MLNSVSDWHCKSGSLVFGTYQQTWTEGPSYLGTLPFPVEGEEEHRTLSTRSEKLVSRCGLCHLHSQFLTLAGNLLTPSSKSRVPEGGHLKKLLNNINSPSQCSNMIYS
jgi:hypothetical protein